MNLLNLEYFLIVTEEMNFTKAAKRLFISQQALSQHIQKLEKHFGILLFDRTPPLTLTPAGKSLEKYARQLLALQRESERELQDIKDFRSGEVTVGVTHVRGAVMLPYLLTHFYKEFPQVTIHLFEGTSLEVQEALLEGRIDVSIGFPPIHTHLVTSEFLMEDQFQLVVPETIIDTYIPEQKDMLLSVSEPSIQVFKNCPFLRIASNTWAGARFDEFCRKANFSPLIRLETKNLGTLISLCMAGFGIIMCSDIFLRNKPLFSPNSQVRLFTYPLKNHLSEHYTAINYLTHKYRPQAVQEFIRISKEVLHN